ncbi:type VI secretion system ATPase TssH [Albidovulum sp.]|uniref:type VI secretion system ATPase TssH n=1 Tax=Albidovulum sp. TaxID=1872424 RepID=UPI001D5A8157|nr:type VI secretion system ATPase TssH [Paracoccaceae bacterium]MCC0046487.1 type VI secretion system ATPase TssH [Defluviimonas sp.]HPE26186.1 type VI secretion system ATPase TssH [Albidovulum sp.]MCB2122006.1 type VI secretion system ATPase TssH [Paracoccaceae bacterium]MCB2132247.1 type VI secretion system ATPase TssH [Paracoccaceae bacterium]
MSEISRVALFGKLNRLAYQAIESATVFCKLRGNPYVELVHWLHQILQGQDSDIHRIIQHYQLDPGRIAADMTRALDALPRGASAISDLSEHMDDATERAWVYGSLQFSSSQIRTGYLILGMLRTKNLKAILTGISGEFGRISPDDLAQNFVKIVSGSPEDGLRPQDGSAVGGSAEPGEASGARAPAQMGKEEALAQFCTDMTQQARDGKIDPIVGRDEEIRQVVDVLMRRRQNNPILTGEAGVGKTAVVEGFALRIARGDVPPSLKEARLLSLDVGLLQAGASMKGEFENRLRSVIEEVQASPVPIIMFVDETHTLVGAGGAAGTGDAANLLKPALARGTLRTIGATTWAEYKKHIEKDPALTRRFQVVQVEEPDVPKAIRMMRGIASMLEKHHRVQVLDEGIEAAVSLSARYIPARQLPDKSVSVLDTACARVSISQHAVPAEVDDSRKRIEGLQTELEIIDRDETAGYDVTERRAAISHAKSEEEARLAALTERWEQEKAVVEEILAIRAKLREGGAPVDAPNAAGEEAAKTSPLSAEERAKLVEDLRAKNAELTAIQGESPLILPIVDAQAVASVVGDWTGIPVGRMMKDEIDTVLHLEDHLAKRVIGQDHAMKMIAKRIRTSRAGLDNPSKPIGVFMLAGTSGVGKTETALALAEMLYGGEHNVITINMSEYQEAHTVSSLKGAPPGYVGYGEGGVLTEAVRRKPYSVVLLDEVEKAHPDVHEIFFQVFDKGVMEDGEGRLIDFKNTLILLTSNAGSDLIMDMCSDPELMPDPEEIAKALRDPLLKIFPAALLGRLVTIPYYPLSPSMIAAITRLQLDRIKKRVKSTHNVPFSYTDAVVDTIVSRCQELESGGRMIDAIVTNTMLPDISGEFLQRMMAGEAVNKVDIDVTDGEFTYAFD